MFEISFFVLGNPLIGLGSPGFFDCIVLSNHGTAVMVARIEGVILAL